MKHAKIFNNICHRNAFKLAKKIQINVQTFPGTSRKGMLAAGSQFVIIMALQAHHRFPMLVQVVLIKGRGLGLWLYLLRQYIY